MKTLEEIRNECRNENHAARRLLSAGFRLEGWDMNTGRRIVARITNENTNDEPPAVPKIIIKKNEP